ncbi:hypothetical protein PV327_000939 [Microctonus hyperodae]|uniref:MD-2-related lipid-recognition domain-containing protein n=1 Tax=Microctonus hyperodae TaxID=165561 RepID=A0AA39L2T7_MICHY|nr:hypothetical protein PV327_000939 [Microctonus hyperodae]
MFMKVLIIASLCVSATLQYTPFAACKAGAPPSELRVEGCTKSPCVFSRGQDVIAEWDFKVVANTENLRPVVLVKAFGMEVDYSLPEQNACNSLINGKCPLNEGESVTYALQMPISPKYPKIRVHLKFSLVDDKDNIHACFEMDAKIVK